MLWQDSAFDISPSAKLCLHAVSIPAKVRQPLELLEASELEIYFIRYPKSSKSSNLTAVLHTAVLLVSLTYCLYYP